DQYNSGEIPSPKAFPSQLNSAGNEPFASNDALRIVKSAPPDELLLTEELLDDELLELEEEEELLEELLLDDTSPPPSLPQAANAADNVANPHTTKILFIADPALILNVKPSGY